MFGFLKQSATDMKEIGVDFYQTVIQNKLLFLGIIAGTVLALTLFGDVNFAAFLPALDEKFYCVFRFGMC